MATRGVNKVILVGHLGKDPEVRHLPNGNAVASFSIATSESWKDKDTGEKQERTEWHRVVCFNRLGEIVGQYVKKGARIYIEGSLKTRKWQDQQGQDRYTTEIIAAEMQMLDNKTSGSSSYDDPMDSSHSGGQSSSYAPRNTPAAQPAFAEPLSGLDDDVPF